MRPFSPQFTSLSAKIQKYLKILLMQERGHRFGVTETGPQFYNFADQNVHAFRHEKHRGKMNVLQ